MITRILEYHPVTTVGAPDRTAVFAAPMQPVRQFDNTLAAVGNTNQRLLAQTVIPKGADFSVINFIRPIVPVLRMAQTFSAWRGRKSGLKKDS
jgi:hypothetical protein